MARQLTDDFMREVFQRNYGLYAMLDELAYRPSAGELKDARKWLLLVLHRRLRQMC